jgi:prevent-host-death family protein
MVIVNMHEAKTNLSKLVMRARSGEDIVLAKAGHPMVRFVSIDAPKKKRRSPGSLKGKIWIAPDFDDTTPEILEMFYGDYDKNLT